MSNNRKNYKILVWLDKDLAKKMKEMHSQSNLSQQLRKFLNNRSQYLNTIPETTIGSFNEMKTMIHSIDEIEQQLKKFFDTMSSFENIMIETCADFFYEDDDYSHSDSDNDDCNRISAYYGALDYRPEELQRTKKSTELFFTLKEKFTLQKIKQIKKFYKLNDQDLENHQTKNGLVKFLIQRVNRNKDVALLLQYKNIHNRFGKLYTQSNIARQRYLLKKHSQI